MRLYHNACNIKANLRLEKLVWDEYNEPQRPDMSNASSVQNSVILCQQLEATINSVAVQLQM